MSNNCKKQKNLFFFLVQTYYSDIIYVRKVGKIMARKKKNKYHSKKRIIMYAIFSVVVIIFTTFTIGKYWVEIIDKYQEKQELEKKLVKLKEKAEELKVDADKLQDSDYIARYAREKYNYSKEGEFILRIP